jgi:hypothetical protein
MNDRNIRSLSLLNAHGSSSRVLNLVSVWRKHADEEDYSARPFFRNPLLNRAIILKHKLRRHEYELFDRPRSTATKLIFPIDTMDLRSGGRSVFLNQKGYEDAIRSTFGINAYETTTDTEVLDVLDHLPSFDPFLLREYMAQKGLTASPCYFEISEADMDRMFRFAQAEVQQLVRVAVGGGADAITYSAKLARKLLASTLDPDMDVLRRTLKMEARDFQEGVFCWKGFLYYKWNLSESLDPLRDITKEVATVQPRGPGPDDARRYLGEARERIQETIKETCGSVSRSLAIYDEAYKGLTERENPTEFRDFLLKAPAMFGELGEKLGALNHIVSFWRYRFPAGTKVRVTPDELRELFEDFEESFGIA